MRGELEIEAKRVRKWTDGEFFLRCVLPCKKLPMCLEVYELREGFYLCISSSQKRLLLTRPFQLRPFLHFSLYPVFSSIPLFHVFMKNINRRGTAGTLMKTFGITHCKNFIFLVDRTIPLKVYNILQIKIDLITHHQQRKCVKRYQLTPLRGVNHNQPLSPHARSTVNW